MAQYDKYWGDQLLPKFVYDEWREHCVDGDGDGAYLSGSMSVRSDACETLEESMDSYIGKKARLSEADGGPLSDLLQRCVWS